MNALTEHLSLYRPDSEGEDWTLRDSFRQLRFTASRRGLLGCDGHEETLIRSRNQL